MAQSTQLAVLWRFFPWKNSFVAVPLVSVVLNIILAVTLSIPRSNDIILLERGSRMLGLVSGASISIVTLTFSLTVLSVQIAAQSYSPRLLDDFLKDPVSKVVISVNLGAYAYCYSLLYFLEKEDDVPYVAIHFLTVHMALVILAFVTFLHLFINGFRLERILKKAADSAVTAAQALSAQLNTDVSELPRIPKRAIKVQADSSGYITDFLLSNLLQAAIDLDLCFRYSHQIGDYVNRGTIICHVWSMNKESYKESLLKRVQDYVPLQEETSSNELEKRLGLLCAKAIRLADRRNSDLDVTLGIQQLTDIAVRALSPGINDPYTAIQCLDVLTAVLGSLANIDLGMPNLKDDDECVRVCAPRRSFSYLLAMLDPIRKYGGSDLNVCRRAFRLFGDLGTILSNMNRLHDIPTILAQLEQWMVVAKENFSESSQELNSLQEQYDYILRDIAESKNITVQENGEVKDLQDFETTYNESDEKPNDRSTLLDFLGKATYSLRDK